MLGLLLCLFVMLLVFCFWMLVVLFIGLCRSC